MIKGCSTSDSNLGLEYISTTFCIWYQKQRDKNYFEIILITNYFFNLHN